MNFEFGDKVRIAGTNLLHHGEVMWYSHYSDYHAAAYIMPNDPDGDDGDSEFMLVPTADLELVSE